MRHVSLPNGVQNEHCLLAVLVDEEQTQSYSSPTFITCNAVLAEMYRPQSVGKTLSSQYSFVFKSMRVTWSSPNTEWATFVVNGY
jgi:hypothetical protein